MALASYPGGTSELEESREWRDDLAPFNESGRNERIAATS
jgi:hypothetical protein